MVLTMLFCDPFYFGTIFLMCASQNQNAAKPQHLPSDLKEGPAFLQGGVKKISPLLLTDLSKLYDRRAKRLHLLSQEAKEDGGEYLKFLEKMVLIQKELLAQYPLDKEDISKIKSWFEAKKDPSPEDLEKEPFLHKIYKAFFQKISPLIQEEHLSSLKKLSDNAAYFAQQSAYLLTGNFAQCDAAAAVPLWACLSLCWAQAATDYAKEFEEEKTIVTSQAHCPFCGTPAVADMVLTGQQEGLRYEQCALCETRWHKVRSICPECLGSEHLDYWSIEEKMPSIEIESCADCKTYSKIFRLDRNPNYELCSDDLASVVLDALVEEKGFSRRTLNPFVLSFPT
ncbi:formate dehydrogenase accessory protein FdhE [Acetobacteraceae bacterium]|nr:formate dehydrogenase accessory protein FdhE [Acetobacteraceae bacterium]